MNDTDYKPNPSDPTDRTIQQLWREVASLKELFESKLSSMSKAIDVAHSDIVRVPTDVQEAVGALKELQQEKFSAAINDRQLMREVIETRLNGMDKAITLLQTASDKFPERIDEKISALEKVHGEKFESTDKQFFERDVRTQQAAEGQTTAVNAALQAQKESAQKQAEAFGEATQKAETQFTKQIDQQGELLRTEVRGLVTQINELKDRFNRGEGTSVGAAANKTDNRLLFGVLIAAVGMIIGIIGLIIRLN